MEEHLIKATEEEIQKYKDSLTVPERVTEALIDEFYGQIKNLKITTTDLEKGIEKFKYMAEYMIPTLSFVED